MAAEFQDVSISISGNRWLEYSELEKKQPSFVAFGLKCLVLLTAEWRCGNVLVLILVA